MQQQILHLLCTAGTCQLHFSGHEHTLTPGSCMIAMASHVGRIQPSEDCQLYQLLLPAEQQASLMPRSSYGTCGWLHLFMHPIFQLKGETLALLEHDFKDVAFRSAHTPEEFRAEAILQSIRILYLDAMNVHAALFEHEEATQRAADIMSRFIQMLEGGSYRQHRTVAYYAQELKKCMHPWPKASNADYTIQYTSDIDDEAYAFMKAHRGNDLWLREQEMLNWIVNYPFVMAGKDESACNFGSNAKAYEYKVVKVYSKDQLVGVYILRVTDDALSVIYIYFAEECKDIVYASIIDQILAIKPQEFMMEDKAFYAYVREHMYYPKATEEKVSLSLPIEVKMPQNISMQLGDGDSFA